LITFLVGRGALIEATDTNGDTPLCYACSKGYHKAAVRLLQLGADVDRAGWEGTTPLMYAVENDDLELASVLVFQFSARLDPVNVSGETTLHLAAKTSLSMLKFLLQSGALIRKKTILGRSVLHAAVAGGLTDVVNFLLKEFFLFSIDEQDSEGSTPFHIAAIRADSDMLAHLLKLVPATLRMELVNATNHSGLSPLHWAWKSLGNTQILLETGALINRRSSRGLTPLMQAACKGGFEVVKELLFCGADHRMIHANGRNALDLARREKKEEIARFLNAWPATRLVCALRAAAVVPRLSVYSFACLLPVGHYRMLKDFLV
jgi:ankyrin repeat protein